MNLRRFFLLCFLVPVCVAAAQSQIAPTPCKVAQPSAQQSPDPKVRYSVRVSEGVSQRLLCSQVAPKYPDEARQKHIEGKVVFRAVINTDGTVSELKVVSGDAMLADSAITAVKQWRYNPYFINGRAVEVETQITVEFKLDKKLMSL